MVNSPLRVRTSSDASPRHGIYRQRSNSRDFDGIEEALSDLNLDEDTDGSGGNAPAVSR